MLCFYKKASNSDCVIQLGRTGRGKWHQMAKGGSASPFTKEGSNYPSALCPEVDITSRLGGGACSCQQEGFPSPQTHLRHPQCPGTPASQRVGAPGLGLPDLVKVEDIQEEKRVKAKKPQHTRTCERELQGGWGGGGV